MSLSLRSPRTSSPKSFGRFSECSVVALSALLGASLLAGCGDSADGSKDSNQGGSSGATGSAGKGSSLGGDGDGGAATGTSGSKNNAGTGAGGTATNNGGATASDGGEPATGAGGDDSGGPGGLGAADGITGTIDGVVHTHTFALHVPQQVETVVIGANSMMYPLYDSWGIRFMPKLGEQACTGDADVDDTFITFGSQTNFSAAGTTASGNGSCTINVTSLAPKFEGTFTATLATDHGDVTVTDGQFRVPL